jgi:hypothetical protein
VPLDRWAAVFGAGALRIASYDAVVESGENLLAHFCRQFLDWDNPPIAGPARINESLDMVDVEIMRSLNILAWAAGRESGAYQGVGKRFVERKADLPIRRIVEEAMQYTVSAIEIDDAMPMLADLHARIANRYRSALVPPFAADGLFDPRCVRTDYIQPHFIAFPGIIEMLRTMLTTLA